ncbi:hypothetical protein Q5O12_27935, partial [Klebsiella pneumoniae]|uniref:hypothetical protein n=1 Tax=Klebsiella pneumoniae TaxID=573 RepID=UPI002730CA7F
NRMFDQNLPGSAAGIPDAILLTAEIFTLGMQGSFNDLDTAQFLWRPFPLAVNLGIKILGITDESLTARRYVFNPGVSGIHA